MKRPNIEGMKIEIDCAIENGNGTWERAKEIIDYTIALEIALKEAEAALKHYTSQCSNEECEQCEQGRSVISSIAKLKE